MSKAKSVGKRRVQLRLTLDVTYRPNGVSTGQLRGNLLKIVRIAADDGVMSGESEAVVDHWRSEVIEVDGITESETYEL
jgi:hypothetical protein